MKVKDLLGKINYSSNAKVVIKNPLYSSGILILKPANRIRELTDADEMKMTVNSFEIIDNVLTIYVIEKELTQ